MKKIQIVSNYNKEICTRIISSIYDLCISIKSSSEGLELNKIANLVKEIDSIKEHIMPEDNLSNFEDLNYEKEKQLTFIDNLLFGCYENLLLLLEFNGCSFKLEVIEKLLNSIQIASTNIMEFLLKIPFTNKDNEIISSILKNNNNNYKSNKFANYSSKNCNAFKFLKNKILSSTSINQNSAREEISSLLDGMNKRFQLSENLILNQNKQIEIEQNIHQIIDEKIKKMFPLCKNILEESYSVIKEEIFKVFFDLENSFLKERNDELKAKEMLAIYKFYYPKVKVVIEKIQMNYKSAETESNYNLNSYLEALNLIQKEN